MCRKGIPPSLRCAVWVTSVVRVSNPQQPIEVTEGYGTLGKVRVLEAGWETVRKNAFSESTDEEDTLVPDFGIGKSMKDLIERDHGGSPLPEKGVNALNRVLISIHHVLGIEYCPLLPDLTAILLTCMPESHAFTTLREMVYHSAYFLPVSQDEHYAWCCSFVRMLGTMYPKTALVMERCGALTAESLDPIFKRFFTPIMRHEHVVRIVDMYTVEGMKLLLRVGLALISLCKKDLKEHEIKDPSSFWNEVRNVTFSPEFDFQRFVEKRVFGYFGSNARRRQFPKRRVVTRMVKAYETWAEANVPKQVCKAPTKPMGYVNGDVPIVLAKPAIIRSSLAEWLPIALKFTKLELIYSTNEHGRSLEQFYKNCARTNNTITLIEVLQTGATVGMYASHAWSNNPGVYGDGECFLFRADPDPKCYKWRPISVETLDDVENEALMEQFMTSNDKFVSMGANCDGTSGLRFNEDLTKGESAPALGYNNEPLAGQGLSDFDIGQVEVYRFVREMDGKAIGDMGDEMWNL